MIFSALGHVLPIAVAVALSSVPVMSVVAILLSPRRTGSAVPFAIGWVVGLGLVATASVLFGRVLPPARAHGREPVVGAAELVIGTALVVLAIVAWRRPRATRTDQGRGWVDTVGSFGPLTCFGLALVLNLRPKGLLLGLAAGLAVAEDAGGPVADVIVLALYVMVSASTVVVPVVLTVVVPGRARPVLEQTRDWLTLNRKVVTGLIMLLVGVVIMGSGLARL